MLNRWLLRKAQPTSRSLLVILFFFFVTYFSETSLAQVLGLYPVGSHKHHRTPTRPDTDANPNSDIHRKSITWIPSRYYDYLVPRS